MRKPVLKCLLALELLIAASQACAGSAAPPVSALDPNAINTAIAGTMAAAATQTAQSELLMASLTPTVGPTKTLSPSPFPTFTVVVAAPVVYVTKNTNCRAGPGPVYNIVGALKVGQFAQVVSRSADGKYWIIRNPNHPDQVCWLSGTYAVVTGVAGALPISTPPPTPRPTRTPTRVPATHTPIPSTLTPTPGFTASYIGTEDCTGTEWWVHIALVNTGQVLFQSVSLILQDITSGGAPIPLASDDFTDKNGCSATDTVDTLPPGAAHTVSSPVLTYNPTGHALRVVVSVCSEPGQIGTCVTKAVDFTP